jgi:hypothetical protein
VVRAAGAGDPVVESKICIGTNPPPGGNELIFLAAGWDRLVGWTSATVGTVILARLS